jgi:hypothetical protein
VPAVAVSEPLRVALNLGLGVPDAEMILSPGRHLPQPEVRWPNHVFQTFRSPHERSSAFFKESKRAAVSSSWAYDRIAMFQESRLVKPRKPHGRPVLWKVGWMLLGAVLTAAILIGPIGNSEGWFSNRPGGPGGMVSKR